MLHLVQLLSHLIDALRQLTCEHIGFHIEIESDLKIALSNTSYSLNNLLKQPLSVPDSRPGTDPKEGGKQQAKQTYAQQAVDNLYEQKRRSKIKHTVQPCRQEKDACPVAILERNTSCNAGGKLPRD